MERLIKVGNIVPKSASQVKSSRMGIGFEKLDRAVFDPEKAYDKVAQLGVKWIRLQSGWARTEKTKGVYDFEWLDDIVDNLLRRGLKPWICLAYGNALYTEEAKTVFGAVGCAPVKTEEERNAWDSYTCALTAHFKGRVEFYEIWNEPNWCWKPTPDGTQYGNFAVLTAKAIKRGDPDAKIIGGCESVGDLAFMNNAFKTGMGDYIDYFSYHIYAPDERNVKTRLSLIRGICDKYNPSIKIIQGETGCPSRSDGHGELGRGAWTKKKQAKYLARRAMVDLSSEVEFASYFSSLDMIEALNGTVGDKASYLDYGYFGILEAEFDANGFSTGTYTPKPSYKAIQTIASVFAEEYDVCSLPINVMCEHSDRIFGYDVSENVMSAGFKRPNGSSAFVYWYPADLMTSNFESTITFNVLPDEEIRVVNLLDGTVYEIPESIKEYKNGSIILKNMPITDYPLLLTFGDFVV